MQGGGVGEDSREAAKPRRERWVAGEALFCGGGECGFFELRMDGDGR